MGTLLYLHSSVPLLPLQITTHKNNIYALMNPFLINVDSLINQRTNQQVKFELIAFIT